MKRLTAHKKYIAKVHERFSRCTPYRLGIAVGEAGDDLPSPYRAGGKADKNYLDGVVFGRRRAAEAKASDGADGSAE